MSLDDDSTGRTAAWATVACILSVSVLSGPFVGAVDLTPPPDGDFLTCQDGTASVEIAESPGEITLERGEFDTRIYTFSGQDAVVHVEEVDGCSRLLYRLQVPALHLDIRQVHFVDESQEGELTLSAPEASVDPALVNRSTYEGTVTIELQGDDDRVLYRSNVTVVAET